MEGKCVQWKTSKSKSKSKKFGVNIQNEKNAIQKNCSMRNIFHFYCTFYAQYEENLNSTILKRSINFRRLNGSNKDKTQ